MSTSKTLRSFRARILTPEPSAKEHVPPLRFEEDAVLVVAASGEIVSVEPFSSAAPGPVLDLRPCVIAPGFVDAHVHFPQARVVGRAVGPLLDWLETTIFPEEQRFSDEAYAREVAAEFFPRLAELGTTAAGVYATSSPIAARVAFEAAKEVGLLAQIGLVLMDRGAPDRLLVPEDRAVADLVDLLVRCGGDDRVRLAVTPRFALSCSPGLLARAAAFAAENRLLLQTHLSENMAECEATLAAFPGARDYLGVYEAAGISGERALFAHAIHLSESELLRIQAAGSKIVHCPDSNAFLGSGRMRLADMLRRRIQVGLGSDVAAGRTLDMRRIAASAYDTALAEGDPVSPETVFALATWGGAQVLGLGARTGALTPGRRADFVVIDVPSYTRSKADVLSHLVFDSDTTKVARTYLAGQLQHRRD